MRQFQQQNLRGLCWRAEPPCRITGDCHAGICASFTSLFFIQVLQSTRKSNLNRLTVWLVAFTLRKSSISSMFSAWNEVLSVGVQEHFWHLSWRRMRLMIPHVWAWSHVNLSSRMLLLLLLLSFSMLLSQTHVTKNSPTHARTHTHALLKWPRGSVAGRMRTMLVKIALTTARMLSGLN